MAATYRLSRWRRLLNALGRGLLPVGLGPRHTYLLTVRGRRSAKQFSIPVTVVEEGRHRWLVAPYGEVSWVCNARAAGQVMPSRGRQSEAVTIVALGPEESAPVLKRYVTEIPITRPYFDATPDTPLEAFVAEAHRHPVFRIHGASA
jgi:deazaflavin-dependent oxidoreductase (nitroreductase family)